MNRQNENWEERYRTGDTPWDKGATAPPLIEYLEQHALGGRVLVPGCGLGHDARYLAQHADQVIGLDISATAIDRAKQFPQPDNLHFQTADFFNLPSSFHGSFDFIFEHTFLCALQPERRTDYVQIAHQLLKPGGRLIAIFYTVIDGSSAVAEGPPFSISPAEIDALFEYAFSTRAAWHPKRQFASRCNGEEQMRVLQRHSD